MKDTTQQLVNLWYKEWLKTHDPYEDDFEKELKEIGLTNFTLAFNPHKDCGNEWIKID